MAPFLRQNLYKYQFPSIAIKYWKTDTLVTDKHEQGYFVERSIELRIEKRVTYLQLLHGSSSSVLHSQLTTFSCRLTFDLMSLPPSPLH